MEDCKAFWNFILGLFRADTSYQSTLCKHVHACEKRSNYHNRVLKKA
jgi:hypothetical protein